MRLRHVAPPPHPVLIWDPNAVSLCVAIRLSTLVTDQNIITRRKFLKVILGGSLMLLQRQPAFAGDKNGDDTGDDKNGGGTDGDPEQSFSGGDSEEINIYSPVKPIRNKGRLLNQDEVKDAISSGKAATLPLLLAYMNLKYPGKVLDVKMRQLDEKYFYEVKLLSNTIFLRTLMLDAKTLAKL